MFNIFSSVKIIDTNEGVESFVLEGKYYKELQNAIDYNRVVRNVKFLYYDISDHFASQKSNNIKKFWVGLRTNGVDWFPIDAVAETPDQVFIQLVSKKDHTEVLLHDRPSHILMKPYININKNHVYEMEISRDGWVITNVKLSKSLKKKFDLFINSIDIVKYMDTQLVIYNNPSSQTFYILNCVFQTT